MSELDCWEAILIDDGSPDGCPQICDEYSQKDRRFRVVHQQNAGVAAARNAGLDIAQGEWVWFVDSDDMVDMRYVGDIIEWLSLTPALPRREGDNLEVDLVMFDLETFKENETLSLRNAVATKRCRYENIACGERFKGSSSSKGSKNVNVNQESVIENQPSAISHQPSAVNVNQESVSVERLAVSESQPSSVIEHSTLNTQHSTLNVTVPNTKNEFLSQYISFFHQQFWFRKSAQLRFTKGIRVSEDLELMYKYFTLCQQPVKFQATLYHYRVRQTSVTQDEDYRKKAVEDLPIVLMNLAEWNKRNSIKTEPWYNFRIMKLMQNLLYSASLARVLNTKDFQIIVVDLVNRFGHQQFPFVKSIKIKLAVWNINLYFILNRFYLMFKRIK